MGQAKREMEEAEQMRDTMRTLVEMVVCLATHPTATISELYELACKNMYDEARDANLTRLLSRKD